MRKGLGIGRGKGYYNYLPHDSYIHSLSAKGVKTLTRVYGKKAKLGYDTADYSLKNEFRSLREEANELTTSDLQGRAGAIAKSIAKKLNLKPSKVTPEGHKFYWELEDLLLGYAYGDMDINTTQRYILDLPKADSSLNALKTFEIPLTKGKFSSRQVVQARNRKEAVRKVRREQKAFLEMKKKGKARCFFCNRQKKVLDADYMDIMDMPESKIKGKIRYMPMDKRESGDNLFGDTPACFKCIPRKYGRL